MLDNLSVEIVAAIAAALGSVVTLALGKIKDLVAKTENKIDDKVLEAILQAIADTKPKA